MKISTCIIVFAAAIGLLAGCGGGTSDTGSDTGGDSIPDNDSQPGFDFVFEGVDESGQINKFSFFPDDNSVGQAEGDFNPEDSGVDLFSSNNVFIERNTLGGSFSGDSINFTVPAEGGPGSTNYSGVFVDDDTIELTPDTPNADILTIRRADESFFAELESKGADPDSWDGFDSANEEHVFRFSLNSGFLEGEFNDATALFTGEEDFGEETNQLSGYFSVDFITFTVTRTSGDETYTGNFPTLPSGDIDPDTIELNDGFTLKRNPGNG